MGQQNVELIQDQAAMRRFTRQIIQDVRALEHMLSEGLFEMGVRRIGAEQELFLIDERGQPAPIAEEVLQTIEDERVVRELSRFNLEFNLDPLAFGGDCLRQLERDLRETLAFVRQKVQALGGDVVLTGILPTIHLSDLTLDNLTPRPRYYALNDVISQLRGGPAQFKIRGVDELYFRHDSILVEGCNTSFQTHFQVDPDEFPHLYNIAQTVAAPCLAAATNSPVLFGKRLWKETRIALFQQAIDTRSTNLYLREMSPRVHFGTRWVEESVTEIFKEDISRFRVLLTADDLEDPFEALQAGRVPKLSALQLHNGTVYRWNRACYGQTNGKPHLRIENRILPSGPTTLDEAANAAFWFGLVSELAREYDDITTHLDFDDATSNFVAASRLGLASQLVWLDGARHPAHHLICDELLPMARRGLSRSEVDADDIDRYLGVLEARVRAQLTGAEWQLFSLAKMPKDQSTRSERLQALVLAMAQRQRQDEPGHAWALAKLEDGAVPCRMHRSRVEHFMSTDLFTVHEDELVEFVACLMDWQRVRHVLVEDNQHQLVGLVTHRNVLRYLSEYGPCQDETGGMPVRDIMVRNPVTVEPGTLSVDAIQLMREKRIGALPVILDGHLVGLVTERDFLHIASQLLDENLEGEDDRPPEAAPPNPTLHHETSGAGTSADRLFGDAAPAGAGDGTNESVTPNTGGADEPKSQ